MDYSNRNSLTPFNGQSITTEQRRPNSLVCLANSINQTNISSDISNQLISNSRTPQKRPTSLNLTSSLASSPASSITNFSNNNNNSAIENRLSQSARSSFKGHQPIKQQLSDIVSTKDLGRKNYFSSEHSKIYPKSTLTAAAAVQSNRVNRVVNAGLQPSRFAVTAANYNAQIANQSLNELVDNFTHNGHQAVATTVAVNQPNLQQSHHNSISNNNNISTNQQSQHQLLTSQLSNKSNRHQSLVHKPSDEEIKQQQSSTATNLQRQNSKNEYNTTSNTRAAKHLSSDNQIENNTNNLLDTNGDQGDIELDYSIKDKYRDCTTNTNGIVFRSGSIHRNNSRKSTAGIVLEKQTPDLKLQQQQQNRSGLLNTSSNTSGLVTSNSNLIPNLLPGSGLQSSSGYSSASRHYKSNLDNELPSRSSIDASAEDLLLDDEELGILFYF